MNPEHTHIGEVLRSTGAVSYGIAEAKPVDEEEWNSFLCWLAEGKNAGMEYMAKYREVRKDPRLLLPGARSIISIAYSYAPERIRDNTQGYIAGYAYGKDYHKVLRKLLEKVVNELKTNYGGEYRVCIDSAPILEKYWAQRAGVGFRGENGSLIVPGYGSMVFLAEIVTTLELDADPPCERRCAGCGRCRAVCPGGALDSIGTIDCRRCINYLTIEHRGDWTEKEALATMNSPEGLNTLYGCDRCITVCPYNKDVPATTIKEFSLTEPAESLTIASVREMDAEVFDRKIVGTPIRRAGFEGLKRNAAFRR